ncbi:MAG: S-layer homology domain-containing protein [Leptolyngbya sp. SIO4C1]|nr:S-layer homology domain-containing protein [Leptolyngbya sp. SIO4C1]
MRWFSLNWKRSTCGLSLGLLVVLSGCEGSQLGARLQQTLEADPQAEEAADSGDLTADASDETAATAAVPEPGQADFIGPVRPEGALVEQPAPEPETTAGYTDVAQAPDELQPYLQDLLALEILDIRSADSEEDGAAAAKTFGPNQILTRRGFARWLLAANNQFYADQSAKRIRPAVGSSQPVFQDVPASDPDFGAIQGLAEAGIIPSPLTGSSTVVTFRPDAPLTRKDLVLWKVPLDARQPLPTATVEAVQQTWGFQDAAKIQPPALQAVLLDHQNGEFANIRRAFGYTTLFQPDKGVTRAEAAAALWRFGSSTEGITAVELLERSDSPSGEALESAPAPIERAPAQKTDA